MQVELLLAPDCPNAAAARAVVTESLDRLGLAVPVRERMGDYASPTILVDGVDAMTEAQGTPAMQACRLDVPTAARGASGRTRFAGPTGPGFLAGHTGFLPPVLVHASHDTLPQAAAG